MYNMHMSIFVWQVLMFVIPVSFRWFISLFLLFLTIISQYSLRMDWERVSMYPVRLFFPTAAAGDERSRRRKEWQVNVQLLCCKIYEHHIKLPYTFQPSLLFSCMCTAVICGGEKRNISLWSWGNQFLLFSSSKEKERHSLKYSKWFSCTSCTPHQTTTLCFSLFSPPAVIAVSSFVFLFFV